MCNEESLPHKPSNFKNKCENSMFNNQSQFNSFHTAKTELVSKIISKGNLFFSLLTIINY